jgi:DNA-directed RNA polymerase specialized sigma24 family protein
VPVPDQQLATSATHPSANAAQEAFLESWALMSRDPDSWQKIVGKKAWIRTVALRRHQRPPGPRRRPPTATGEVLDLPSPGPGPGLEELTAQTQLVLRVLRSLDQEARAVMAFDLDDTPTADIACALKITQQRVRDVKKKARSAGGGYCSARVYRAPGVLAPRRRSRHRGRAGRVHRHARAQLVRWRQRYWIICCRTAAGGKPVE